MRYPEFLKNGQRIGFIAPSFGAATEPYESRFNSAIKMFSGKGYSIVEGPNARASKGIGKSNTSEKCAEEINDFFINNRSDIIVSCGGGELMCEDLPFVDFEKISSAVPKWFIGYSDNTNLTFLLPTLCDTAAIYGPCASDFGMVPLHPSICDAMDLLEGKKLSFNNYDGWEKEWPERETDPCAPYNVTEPYSQRIFGGKASETFSGRLLGGCLDCLVTLCGTKFDKVKEFNKRYEKDGIIWFIEACDLGPMGIRRALWELENAGWFDTAKGFIIGRSLHYAEDFDGFTCYDAYSGILSKKNVPIIMDIDLGHLSPMLPIICGAKANITTKENSFNISMELS